MSVVLSRDPEVTEPGLRDGTGNVRHLEFGLGRAEERAHETQPKGVWAVLHWSALDDVD